MQKKRVFVVSYFSCDDLECHQTFPLFYVTAVSIRKSELLYCQSEVESKSSLTFYRISFAVVFIFRTCFVTYINLFAMATYLEY